MPHSVTAGLRLAVAAAITGLMATAALAAGWDRYDNVRFGYGIDVPPGFVGGGESDNGDGQVFATATARLTVFGGWLLDEDFEAFAKGVAQQMSADGVGLTYQVSTPSNASFSGKQGGKIVYVRLIPLCGGDAYGEFELRYGKADLTAFDPIVTRLVQSFAAREGAC